MTWNESDHPRDDDGRFTFKEGGVGLKGRIEKTENNSAISNVSDKLSAGEIVSIAINVLGKLATPALILYSDINNVMKAIKENKLEDKFNVALQNTIREKEKNIKNISSVNNKSSNKEYKVNNVKYSSKIKEDSINFLGSDKRKNNNIELGFKQNKKYKDILLDVLGNKATQTDILYGTKEKLEKKIKEYGLEDKLKGAMTGGASSIENQETKHKAKLLPKIELNNTQTPLKGGISYDEIKISSNLNNGYFSSDFVKKAREFIQDSEGFSDKAYQDKAGVWTIGYGHTGYVNGKPISQGMKITEEKAEELYKKDFENHIAPLKDIKTPLTKNQQIALSSFIYNFGVGAFNKSELRKKIEAGDIKGAASEFDKWIYIKNKNTGKKEVSQGLVNRRKREKDLFLNPDD